jgi:hypothetical protein
VRESGGLVDKNHVTTTLSKGRLLSNSICSFPEQSEGKENSKPVISKAEKLIETYEIKTRGGANNKMTRKAEKLKHWEHN